MAKKEIKIYQSFEELEADDLRMYMEMSLQERWDTFWSLRKLGNELLGKVEELPADGKKRIIITRPEWI